jgi:hypothetical protein
MFGGFRGKGDGMPDTTSDDSGSTPGTPPHERRDLYEDDLTDERGATPLQIEEASHTEVLDPQQDSDEPG